MNPIKNIIDKLLERTDNRWFLRVDLDELNRPIEYARRYVTNEYNALFLQMLTTMINPWEVIEMTPANLINLLSLIENNSPQFPEIERKEKILHKFMVYYTDNVFLIRNLAIRRYEGLVEEEEDTVKTVDLVRAHYWLLRKTQPSLLPSTTYFIIGAGGVGWWVAELINMFARNARIVVYDFDSIEPHNFNRLPLSYLVLLEKDDLRKALLLKEKLEPIAQMHGNELITVPSAFTEKQLSGVKQEARENDQIFFIEATDSPKFQLWIRKALRELGEDNVWLIQGHYDTKFPNMWGHVEAFPADMIPMPKEEEIERASDYAEGQSIGLPPFLVADVIRLVINYIDQTKRKKKFELGPLIITEQQINAFMNQNLIL